MCLFPHLHQWKAESAPVGHQRRLHLQSADQCAVLPGSEAGVLGFHLRPAPRPGCAVSREIGREKAHLSECAGGPGRTYQKVRLWTDKTGVSSGAGAGQGPSCTWLASWAALRRSVGRTFPSAAFSCRDLELRNPSSPSGRPPAPQPRLRPQRQVCVWVPGSQSWNRREAGRRCRAGLWRAHPVLSHGCACQNHGSEAPALLRPLAPRQKSPLCDLTTSSTSPSFAERNVPGRTVTLPVTVVGR